MSRSDLDGILYVLTTLYPDFVEGFEAWQQFMAEEIGSIELDERLNALRQRREQ